MSTGTAKKMLVQVKAPTDQRGRVKEWGISFDGATPTDPGILVQLLRQSAAGTGGASFTLTKTDPRRAEGIQHTARTGDTNNPTELGEIWGGFVSPQGGLVFLVPQHREEDFTLNGGEYFAITVTATVAVNARPYMVFDE